MEPTPGWSRAVVLAAGAWTVAIFVFLWMPPPPPPEIVWWWWDKLVHFGLMATFGGLWTWHRVRVSRLWPLGVLVGAVTELGQGMLPWERHSSWDDFAFDVIGLVVGTLVGRVLWLRRNGDRPPWS